MSKFGWSLPPGCSFSDLPGEREIQCDVCGNSEGQCICSECPVCGECGNPLCYAEHGMIRSEEQIAAHKAMLEARRQDVIREDKEWEALYEDAMQEEALEASDEFGEP